MPDGERPQGTPQRLTQQRVGRVDQDRTDVNAAVGHAAAVMFGADPRQQIDDDLLRFKSFMETGKTTGREGETLRH